MEIGSRHWMSLWPSSPFGAAFPTSLLETLASSMPRLIFYVINKSGGAAHYWVTYGKSLFPLWGLFLCFLNNGLLDFWSAVEQPVSVELFLSINCRQHSFLVSLPWLLHFGLKILIIRVSPWWWRCIWLHLHDVKQRCKLFKADFVWQPNRFVQNEIFLSHLTEWQPLSLIHIIVSYHTSDCHTPDLWLTTIQFQTQPQTYYRLPGLIYISYSTTSLILCFFGLI